MQKIKTVQPYKLYKKILKDRSKAKFALIGAVVVLLSSMVFDPDLGLVLVPLFLILSIPLTIYNPKLKAEYEPGVSYKYFRNYKNLQSKLPKALLDKEEQMRLENHQDVDFNVKVDLNDIYGVTDKLVMSYQNFSYEKKKMEDGDYLLGISPQGVYYVSKNQAVTKTKINFGDIDTLGLLAGIGNVFVFHIISKQNDEINIIVDQNDSLLVSPFMLFSALLKLVDDYILNGGVVANPSSKRRVVVSSGVGTSSGSTSASTQDATNNNRVIDLSYSTGVLEDMRTATFVGSNRQIEVDEHVTSKVVNESPDTPVVNRPSNETVSNRNIDLDDLIGSHITDAHRDYNETKTPLVQPVQVFQARTEIPQDETPKVENLEIETSKSSAPVIETPAVETSRNKTSQVDVSEIGTTKPEQPKKKSKTGLIIGIVAGVLAIAAFVGFFVIKGSKGKDAIVQKDVVMEDNNSDPCLTILNQLYNGYVLHDGSNFADVVDGWFTKKGKQKLVDAYDYECYDEDCYGIWALRTMAQDGDGESKIIDILQIGNGKYTVKYLDMGAMGETMVTFAEENGKMKIDDFRTIFDESYDENVGYLSFDLAGFYSNKNENEFGCLFLYYDGSYMTVGYNWPEEKGHYVIQNNEVMFAPSAVTNIEDDPTKWIEVSDRAFYVLPIDNTNQKVGRYTKEAFLTEKEVAEAKAEYGDDCVFMVGGDGFCTRSTLEEFKQKSAFDDENTSTPSQSVSIGHSQNQVVVIDGSKLRLRLGPSTSSDTFKWPDGTNRHPKVGDKFKYLGESGDFYKIDFNGNELWVSKQFSHIE
jgi:hypothetical protein